MTPSNDLAGPRSAASRFALALGRWAHMVLLLCAACCVSARPAQAGINVWTSHGPGGGPVRALAIDPTTPSTLYAGTFDFEAPLESGAFKSTDGGRTWDGINSGVVLALAVDPITPGTLYVGGQLGLGQPGLGHVFKSTDRGDAWSDTGFPFQPVCAVSALAIDPVIPGTLYAGTTQIFPCKGSLGLLRSSDGGTSWINTSLGGPVWALAIDPTVPDTIYAGMSNGVFKSTDGGNTWSAMGIGSAVPALAIDPTTPNTVYAASEAQVYKSTDGAHTWRDTGLVAAATSLRIDPTSTNTLYVGSSDGVFKSTDGGSTWRTLNGGLTSTFVYALAIDPATPATLYAGTEEGVFSIQQVSACAGDCNDDGAVRIDELLMLVNAALGDASISACLAGDHNEDGTITVDEILAAVRIALTECPVPPTSTITPTTSVTGTPTITPTPSVTPTHTPTPSVTSTVTGTPPTSTPTATALPTG